VPLLQVTDVARRKELALENSRDLPRSNPRYICRDADHLTGARDRAFRQLSMLSAARLGSIALTTAKRC
jgi:hypothetical protein